MNTTDEFLEDGTPNPNYKKPDDKQETEEERIERLAEERAAEKLKDIKGKLDNAYKSRDEANARAAELELKERDALKAKLEAEGKFKELYEMQIQEANDKAARLEAEKQALEKANLELTRDNNLRDALKGLSFRNDKAANSAYKDIVSELVQNDQGVWIHKSGVSIRDYVTAFSKDEENSFLFKVKGNSGTGSSTPDSKAQGENTSLFKMSQSDVLKAIQSGKIKARK